MSDDTAPNNPPGYHDIMSSLNYKCIVFGAWCGAICAVLVLVGWWFTAQFLPPHDPAAEAEVIAGIYQENAFRIHVGMILMIFAAGFYIRFTAAVTTLITRIEGGFKFLSVSDPWKARNWDACSMISDGYRSSTA